MIVYLASGGFDLKELPFKEMPVLLTFFCLDVKNFDRLVACKGGRRIVRTERDRRPGKLLSRVKKARKK